MKKSKLAITLNTLLDKMNLSASELARKTGIGQPVIHRMASGTTDNPKIETLRPLAKFFSVSLDQLIGDLPLPPHYPAFHIEQNLQGLPLLTLEEATHWPQHKIQAHRTLVHTDIQVSPLAYAIKLTDSTMYPLFPDGTLLIIDPAIPHKHKDFVIACIKGQPCAIFKQLLIDGQDYYLKSANPDYPLKKMHKTDKILGVMLQARINFRRN